MIHLTDEQRKLVEDNMKLVGFTLGKYFTEMLRTHSGDSDDMCSIGYLGLCKAAASYDSEKGAFSTYAVGGIKNEIIREIQWRNRKQRDQKNIAYSLNEVYTDHASGAVIEYIHIVPDTGRDMESAVLDKIVDEQFLNKLRKLAPTAYVMFTQGLQQYELAKIQGVSRQAVGQRFNRDLIRIKRMLDIQEELAV